MKYISVAILLVLMGWTWSLAEAPRAFSLRRYQLVEAGVENDVRALIVRKYPATAAIDCRQMYLEVVTPGEELIAHFRCQADAPAGDKDIAEQIFEGHIRLRSSDGFQSWDEVGGEIRSPEVRFRNGIHVTPQPSRPEPSVLEEAKGSE